MSVVIRSCPRRAAMVLGLAVLSMVGVAPGREQAPWIQILAWIVLVAFVATLLWLRRRERIAYEAALTEQAARAAVAEDRLTIARDLHDLVSGSLGAITVRAAVAQRLETDEAGLRTALTEVEATSRAATADLRSMLAVLRGQGAEPPPASFSPAGPSSLADAIEQAAAETRELGLDVRTRTEPGDANSAASALALAVVREGLANAARYAGPGAVDVSVRADDELLRVDVTDAGPAPGWVVHPGTGTGLMSLAERAAAVGARLSAGPRDGHDESAGFRLSARIPLNTEVRP
ncbi:sensor histidine kinase [Actinomyces ruminicola]|nr:histidine kinase [Actinomyces ruminicola]